MALFCLCCGLSFLGLGLDDLLMSETPNHDYA